MFLDELSKHRGMGKPHKFFSLFVYMVSYLESHHVYHALPFFGKGILLILGYKHIFLSVGMINILIIFSFPLFSLTFPII